MLNSIISDVLSSNKKAPIDLTIMDFSQMFDSEDVSICLNALYEAEVKDEKNYCCESSQWPHLTIHHKK